MVDYNSRWLRLENCGMKQLERAIRTAKAILWKNEDFHNALLIYRSTPLQNGLSPSEFLMGRRLRPQLPVHPMNLQPNVTTEDSEQVKRKEASSRLKQQNNFNKAKYLAQLKPGDAAWTQYPRSYLVKTEKGGMLRRNRSALVTIGPRNNPETGHADTDDSETTQHAEVEDGETLSISNPENPPPSPTTTASSEDSLVPSQVTRRVET
ncbi:Hypothetical predicted protein [Paramuricea clavata]|uniref:Uncharacterized protein n=1 Tax=Paramuricea clavata TaxID=317549 RepID=A0A7D9HR71_PARCT|nr:Hypothetical predicted protein [Paramuricea clavata]